ncbi:MAG: TerB family tellurite resistance protein [Luminiphilus sp.]
MLKSLFETLFSEKIEQKQSSTRELASAALLVEVARADFEITPEELARLISLLAATFDMSPEDVELVTQQANDQVENAVSLHDFTRVINEHCSPEERSELIGLMWQVAAADGDLSKYEDHLIRRVADLLYVPHQEFIRLKHQALAGDKER